MKLTIKKEALKGKDGYTILGDDNKGIFVFLDEGTFGGHNYKKIRMEEVFLTKTKKELRAYRKPMSAYDKKNSNYNCKIAYHAEMIPEIIEVLARSWSQMTGVDIVVTHPDDRKDTKAKKKDDIGEAMDMLGDI